MVWHWQTGRKFGLWIREGASCRFGDGGRGSSVVIGAGAFSAEAMSWRRLTRAEKDGKDCWGYIQLHSTQTDEKIRSKELDDCLYVVDLGCRGPQELALRVLPCLIPGRHSPSIKHCVSEHQTSV